MEIFVFKKNKIKLVALSFALVCKYSFAATSLMVSGHAGLVGEYTSTTPPLNSTFNAFRVPIGLTLQASPSDNLNIYLGLDYAYNNYPEVPTLMGQTSSTSGINGDSPTNANGQSTPMPFANTVNGSTPYGQKKDTPTLTTAYFTYQTSLGLLKAGRMPRNWGLGVWYSDQWSATNGSISTSDAIAFTTDLNLFDVTVYYERLGQSVGGTSSDGNATAYSVEARLKMDTADIPSTGVTREIGFAYSKFDHEQSNTSLNIIDAYGKFYLSRYFIGGEVLYPSGHTQNPNYQSLGGAPACSVTAPSSSSETAQSCAAENFSAIAALLKFKLQVDSNANTSIAATEASQQLIGTAERQTSNILGLWIGYASGGSNQFDYPNDPRNGDNISAIMMNPNIQPSFLMFNNTVPPINGMPTGAVTNTTFVSLDYTYETPGFGALGPILTWGKLNRINSDYDAAHCSGPQTVDSTTSVNRVCVGGSTNLGVELDASYHYTTLDRVNFGIDVGYWFVGSAWHVYGQGAPDGTYGVRVSTGTEF